MAEMKSNSNKKISEINFKIFMNIIFGLLKERELKFKFNHKQFMLKNASILPISTKNH